MQLFTFLRGFGAIRIARAVGEEPDLGMRVQLVHGDETIADSEEAGGLAAACDKFQGMYCSYSGIVNMYKPKA